MRRNLNIIALESHFPFLKDCIDALIDLCCNVKIIDIDRVTSTKEILSFRPHFIFGLDATGFKSKILKELKIPRASWFIDKPFYWINNEDLLIDAILFVYDRVYIDRLKMLGLEDVFYLPSATNQKIFREIRLSPSDIDRFRCKISFVGNSIDYHSRYLRFFKDPKDRAIAEEAIRIQIENPLLNISDILEEVEKAYGSLLSIRRSIHKDIIEMCLEGIASSRYRLEMIKRVSDLGLHLYGDEGWRKMIDGKIKFLGSIDYHSELPILYNATDIHLNLTRIQLKSALNQRVFDSSACGCFVLSDYRHDLGSLFELGKEVVYFRDKEELWRLVIYFLEHPEERKEFAMRAKERVLKEHTFRNRMETVVDIMRKRFNL